MSWQLSINSFASRVLFKSTLRYISNPLVLRKITAFLTKVNTSKTKGVSFVADSIPSGMDSIQTLWVKPLESDDQKVIYYIHGGGFAFGKPDLYKHLLGSICKKAGIVAMLPQYSLAPENKFPKGADDVFAGYQSLLDQGYNSKNIVVAGDSAGGNLSLGLIARLLKAKKPLPSCVFTFGAQTDFTMVSKSLVENAKSDCVLAAERFKDMIDLYAPGVPLEDPLLSPLFANFKGAPPVFMQASKDEILIEDNRSMYAVLKEHGVDATLVEYDNSFHVFQVLFNKAPEADAAIDEVVEFLGKHV